MAPSLLELVKRQVVDQPVQYGISGGRGELFCERLQRMLLSSTLLIYPDDETSWVLLFIIVIFDYV